MARPPLQGLLLVFREVVAGHDRDDAFRVHGMHLLRQVQRPAAVHIDFRQDQAGALASDLPQGIFPVVGFADGRVKLRMPVIYHVHLELTRLINDVLLSGLFKANLGIDDLFFIATSLDLDFSCGADDLAPSYEAATALTSHTVNGHYIYLIFESAGDHYMLGNYLSAFWPVGGQYQDAELVRNSELVLVF